MVGDEPGHGAGEVGVDDQGIGLVNARSRSHAHGAPALEENLLDLVVERDRGTQVLGGPRHHRGDCPAAAQRMKDAVLVLEEREDREEARAIERRHPQVFRLERHRQPDPRVVEIAAELAVEREPGPEQGKDLQELGREQVAPAQEGRFEDAPELVHLDPIVGQEPRKLAGVAGRERGDRLFHPGDVGRGLELASAAEDEMILRIEPDHRHLGVQISADGGEDRFEHPGIEEEGRPQVKAEAILADRRGPPADPRLALQHGHLVTGPGQQHGAGQAAGARTDDDNPFRSGHGGGQTPIIVCSQ